MKKPNHTWIFMGLSFLALLIPQFCCAQDDQGVRSDQQVYVGGDAGYRVGVGDILEVNVWREPVLSGEVGVRNDGMISLVLLGDVQAAGRTPMELRDTIQKGLAQYVENPVVTVIVRSPMSQKFYVIGEVRAPGEYDLTKDLTVIQAIARAGGFTEWANKDDIVLLRSEGGVERRIFISYKDIVKGKGESKNTKLQMNDTILVP